MGSKKSLIWSVCVLFLVIIGCAPIQPKPPVDRASVEPGGVVSRGDQRFSLLGTPISMGKPLPSVQLVDAMNMEAVDLSRERGKILFLSIVPSIDTRVCEAQTHLLGEEGDKLPLVVERITISRDTPFAQKRFAQEAKLTDVRYLSDYKEGDFGRSTGLLMDGFKLLARSVILVDKYGLVRYIQVVPEMTHLPDMEGAFRKAIELAKEH
ncbi:MAG: redoxin family protein [Deltaproteobacteria bacterium]|nr:redoxin family protein [Deltaproteobacteria bacterium]NIS60540.1 redoxin family protein [Pseudomonadota bacterium]